MKNWFLWVVLGAISLSTGSLWAQGTATPTFTPTPTSGDFFTAPSLVYNNSDVTVATTLGCTVAIVDVVRQLNLDTTTSYILMRLCAFGVPLDLLLQMRLTMGWDQICAKLGLDWSSFSSDLQNRMGTLQPEVITPNQLLRGAANDPNQFPVTLSGPMPVSLTTGIPVTEACPLCN